jgi:rhamnosyltransferase
MPLSLPVAAMRRMAWMAHPFYTDAWGSEDTEWGVWARNAEISIAYVPQALAMHSHNYTLRQNYGRRFIEGEADAFIYRREARLIDFCKACILAFARETWEHLRVRDLRGLAAMPPRVVVSQWGYLQGLRLGARRRRTGDVDVQIGQQTVLNRHESVRKKEAGRL